MAPPEDWDLDAFVDACPIGAWAGTAWRAHKRRYDGTDPGGSLRFSGRYNRGLDQFSEAEIWPALYLALAAEISLGEIMRHLTPELLPVLNDYRIRLESREVVYEGQKALRAAGATVASSA